jgi:hypothetical protein
MKVLNDDLRSDFGREGVSKFWVGEVAQNRFKTPKQRESAQSSLVKERKHGYDSACSEAHGTDGWSKCRYVCGTLQIGRDVEGWVLRLFLPHP